MILHVAHCSINNNPAGCYTRPGYDVSRAGCCTEPGEVSEACDTSKWRLSSCVHGHVVAWGLTSRLMTYGNVVPCDRRGRAGNVRGLWRRVCMWQRQREEEGGGRVGANSANWSPVLTTACLSHRRHPFWPPSPLSQPCANCIGDCRTTLYSWCLVIMRSSTALHIRVYKHLKRADHKTVLVNNYQRICLTNVINGAGQTQENTL